TSRTQRDACDSICVDEERILVRAMHRAAIFDDSQAPGGYLVDDAVVEKDNAIGNVLFKSLAGNPRVAALGGNYCGDSPVFQPTEKSLKFIAQNRIVGETPEQRFQPIEHDTLCAD